MKKKKKIFPYRRTWVVSPITKVKKSKRIYKRNLTKQEIDKVLKQEDF